MKSIIVVLLAFQAMATSLSPLKNLRTLSLSDIPQFYNLEALLTLPKLTKLEYFSQSIDPKYNDVLRDLKGRGVEVRAFQ